jgi:chorismate mutase
MVATMSPELEKLRAEILKIDAKLAEIWRIK